MNLRVAAAVAASAFVLIGSAASAETLVALLRDNRLVEFDHATPQTIARAVAVTGLAPGESLLGIDFRPKTGALYALGSASSLYRIDRRSGAATRVGSPGGFTLHFGNPPRPEPHFGFDFDPVNDFVRVLTDTGQNIRINADNGTLIGVDENPTYAQDDRGYSSGYPFADLDTIAYSNSFPGARTTVLHAIEVSLGAFVSIEPPQGINAVRTIGYLGFAGQKQSGIRGNAALEISGATGTAYAALLVSESHLLCTINLPTGRANVVARIGTAETVASESVVALAAPAPARLLNIATRGRVGRDNERLIGGFIITGAAPARVVVRALGPSLASSGLDSDTLADPVITLHDDSGAAIATNDNWRSDSEAELSSSGLAPKDDREAALIATLLPGAYTAVVSGADGTTGVGLVEIYRLD